MFDDFSNGGEILKKKSDNEEIDQRRKKLYRFGLQKLSDFTNVKTSVSNTLFVYSNRNRGFCTDKFCDINRSLRETTTQKETAEMKS